MDQALLALQIASSGVLLVAATGKALRADDFGAALRLSHMPLAKLFLYAVPVVEFSLALALLIATPATLTVALAATTGLFVAFTVWAVSVLGRGIKLKCGCFGGSSKDVTATTVIRNIVLVAMSGTGLVLSTTAKSPLSEPTLWSAVTASSIAMLVAVLVALRFGFAGLVLKIDSMRRSPVLQIESKG